MSKKNNLMDELKRLLNEWVEPEEDDSNEDLARRERFKEAVETWLGNISYHEYVNWVELSSIHADPVELRSGGILNIEKAFQTVLDCIMDGSESEWNDDSFSFVLSEYIEKQTNG